MAELTDDDLVAMYRDGDVDAFDALFDRYSGTVYNFARVMLGNADGAEDVMQETFMAITRTARSYEPRGRFRSWLLRVVRNRCLNRLQAQSVRRRVLAESGLGTIELPSREPTPADRAAATEELALVERRIAELPERQREALCLYAYEQMTYRDIAQVLELPINTVKTLIHRARAALASALAREGGNR